jgi:hypothetical protein
MLTWLRHVQSNPLLLAPRVFAAVYGFFGFIHIVVALVALFAFLSGNYPRPESALEALVVVVLIGYMIVAIGVSLSLARNFWRYRRPGLSLALFIHGLFLVAPAADLWNGTFNPERTRIELLVGNAVMFCCLLLPPLRRLFR